MNTIKGQDSILRALLSDYPDQNKSLSLNQLKKLVDEIGAPQVAHALESLPPQERKLLWSLVDQSIEGEVLHELNEELQLELLQDIELNNLVEMIGELELDEMVDILQTLPDQKLEDFLSRVSRQDRERIEKVLEYPEDTAGGLLNTDVISVKPRHTLEVVFRYLRAKKDLPQNTDKIFVVSRDDQYLGELPISKMLVSEPNLTVRELMETDKKPISADVSDAEVARLFEQEDLVSAAVVDENQRLLGRITVDDVVDVIIEDADQNFLGMAGIVEDTFAPPGRAAKSRVLWLTINLATAFLASATISIFQDSIDKLVYLAILMPIVASMGGVAATQTLTIFIRGMSLQQINATNITWLFKREVAVSIINGIVLSIIIGAITYFWFEDILISALICIAMSINLVAAVIAGVFVPTILRSLNQDPAVAGSVVVTTVTDVVGFFSFLGLATIYALS
ncbi:MAG: magnesium transporter [Proteobacteria bacterium]|jgi:magnesium transporter|nr:magnesium transporter [Pseudomonadota bacterium]